MFLESYITVWLITNSCVHHSMFLIIFEFYL